MRHADDVLQASTRARAWPARRAGCAVGAADRWEAAPSVQRPGSRYRPQDAGDASRMAWDCQWSLLRCRGRDPRLHDAGTSPSHLRCWSERLRGAMVTAPRPPAIRSEEHTSELQSLMRSSYAVFCLQKKKKQKT